MKTLVTINSRRESNVEECFINNWIKEVGKKTGYEFNAIIYLNVYYGSKFENFFRNLNRKLSEHYKLQIIYNESIGNQSYPNFIKTLSLHRVDKIHNIKLNNCCNPEQIFHDLNYSDSEFVIIDSLQSIQVSYEWIHSLIDKFPNKRFLLICRHQKFGKISAMYAARLNKHPRMNVVLNVYQKFVTYKLKQ